MLSSLQQKMDAWKQRGILTIITALLFELLLVLWLSFFLLFTLETLLPTFVTVRLSLTNFLAVLILGTVLYLSLEKQLDTPRKENKTPRLVIWGVSGFGFILIALSLARFPLIGGIIFLAGYLFLTWLLVRFVQEK